jgi:CubicO group peptidase (beta-lactamase class C family)
LANVGDSVPVTPDTVFHICSISKNILAAVVLKLAEQGKLSLDDEVTKYIPEAPLHGRRVTIRQLLDHVSGIYSFTSLPEADANERLDLSQQQVLDLIKDKPPLFEPGTNWRYDNSGFYMAGMIVERVTKQDYGSYVRDNIFKPIGMGSASLCYARDVVPHLSSGYEREGGKLVKCLVPELETAVRGRCSVYDGRRPLKMAGGSERRTGYPCVVTVRYAFPDITNRRYQYRLRPRNTARFSGRAPGRGAYRQRRRFWQRYAFLSGGR